MQESLSSFPRAVRRLVPHRIASAAAVFAVLAPAAALAVPYTVSRSPETLIPLPIPGGSAVSTVLGGSGADDVGVRPTLPSGFTFKFYDQTYSSVMVSSNGYLTFEPNSSGTVYSQKTFPNTSNPTDIVAVWWADATCYTANSVRLQTLGAAPNRQVVIEWACQRRSQTNPWVAQAWLTEGSSTISVLYGTYASPGDYTSVIVGVQNRNATEFTYGLCTGTCLGSVWPTNTRLIYSQGPELSVAKVDVPAEGFAGIRMPVTATIRNSGGEIASNFRLQLWVSPVPTMTGAAVPVGTSAERRTATPGQVVTFSMDPRLPVSLGPGTYYIIAEADPDHVVPVSGRGSTFGSSSPFTMGVPAPNLAPAGISVPQSVEPGETFDVSWTATNRGNAPAIHAPYHVVLSTHDSPSPASLVLFRGTFDLEAQRERPLVDRVAMPESVPTGRYFVGVIIDPDLAVYEHDKNDNTGVSNPILVSARSKVSIVTPAELPEAELGSPYSVVLEASGGDGFHAWHLEPGSRLPPGLALVELPEGAREAGFPFVTLLEGAPAATGDFEIAMSVRSGMLIDRRTFHLGVRPALIPLEIHTWSLPAATFDLDYEVKLAATGGSAPYVWSMQDGRLPAGLHLDPSGVIAGRPRQDGSFPFAVRVTDSVGVSVSRDMTIAVVSPAIVSCGTTSLPPHRIGAAYDEQLHAAGTSTPVWSTRETYFLATNRGEQWEWHKGEAPPGIVLHPTGKVTGAATRAGSYEWLVEVRDGLSPSGRSATCVIRVEVLLDQGLTVLNQTLPDAMVGQHYAAQLEVSGGEGKVAWSLAGGAEKLPAGLTLTSDGRIEGTPTGAELAGEETGSVSFLVRASDPHNRVAVAALSILLNTKPQGPAPKETVTETRGCQAAGAEASLLAAAAVAGLAALRRRR